VSLILKRIAISATFKKLYKEGRVSFATLNDVRERWGLHRLSQGWSVKYQALVNPPGKPETDDWVSLRIHYLYRGYRLHRCETVSVQCLEIDWVELYSPYVKFLRANVKADKLLKLHIPEAKPEEVIPSEYLSKYRSACQAVGAHSLELNGLAKLHPSHPNFRMS
jgi:hypothetical protein